MMKFWMVYVFDREGSTKRYYNRTHAEKDAKRLCRMEGATAVVLEVVHAVRPLVETIDATELETPGGNAKVKVAPGELATSHGIE